MEREADATWDKSEEIAQVERERVWDNFPVNPT